MDIKPVNMTVKQLLGAKCQFAIPRFQRDYSWENSHYQEFLDDMLINIFLDNGQLKTSQYFLGTMLFIGTMEKAGEVLNVVDGQQRLTTITILFSALSDHFREIKNDKLSQRIFDYIMSEDDNGESVRILKSETSYPFFSYYIQDRDKSEERAPSSEEEECIKNAFEYLYRRTSQEELNKYMDERFKNEASNQIKYEEILKAIRDQVLSSTVVAICTKDKNDANKIFEILNAKGKRLASIDLIKNKIFGQLSRTEPADMAEEKWRKIKENLYSGKNTVGIATFFRHYWTSKYTNASENTLYDKFEKKIKKDKESYKDFLDDLVDNSKYYSRIINPSREDYGNRKEYYGLVQSLKIITNDFNIVQIRILLMSLFDAKNKGLIRKSEMEDLITYLEGFHFVYNALLARRANVLNSIYSKYARLIRRCDSHNDVTEKVKELKRKIDKNYPSFQDFKKAFIRLIYSKKENPDNVKTKYAINKINAYYSGDSIFSDAGSIEHILPEMTCEKALNIGNMILLEQSINREADNTDFSAKMSKYYPKSNYKWMREFIAEHKTWTVDDIDKRASKLADFFYEKVLDRRIS